MVDAYKYSLHKTDMTQTPPETATQLERARVGLTPAQHNCLLFISGYLKASGGVSPSFEEIREALGLASRSSVTHLVNKLEERGYIKRAEGASRSIMLLD